MAKEGQKIYQLFSGKKRYYVPRYQRRYVWGLTNWVALWRNIIQLPPGKNHFTGSIITQSYAGESSPSENGKDIILGKSGEDMIVIDGQQRLTTFQIIFCIIRDLFESGGYTFSDNVNVNRLKFRALDYVELNNTESRLIFTKSNDREAFQLVVSRELWNREIAKPEFTIQKAFDLLFENGFDIDGKQSAQHSIITAYGYFGAQITDHLEKEGSDKLAHLMDVLEHRFHVMSAELETDDEPQQAYGSSNDTGVALDEFDLLRNNLFLRAKSQETQDTLYDEHWEVFDTEPFWQVPGMTDKFLQDFLMAKLGPIDFGKQRLFHDVYKGLYHTKLRAALEIKDENNSKFVKTEFEELAKYAETYQEMENPTTDIGRRRQFYNDLNLIFENLNLTSLPPFILAVENELGLDSDERNQVYQILESYILRCQLAHGVNEDKTTSLRINALFSCLDMFSYLIKNTDKDVEEFGTALTKRLSNGNVPVETWIDTDRVVAGLRRVGYQIAMGEKFSTALAGLLCSGDVPGRTWLDNDQVLAGLRRVGRQIENGSSSARRPVWDMLRYIFYRIECLKREDSSTVLNGVRLSFDDFFRRYALIKPMSKSMNLKTAYSIGNLTFCEEPLPEHFPFPKRKDILLRMPNARLLLNKEMVDYSTWDTKQILQEREKGLLTCFHEIWPPAADFTQATVGTETETRWISITQSDEYQPIRFATYERVEELSRIKIRGGKVIGVDLSNNEQTLEKQNILFACSTEAWQEVSPYVEILGYVKRDRLRSPRDRNEFFYLKDNFLASAQREQTTVIPVTRYGHKFEGTIESFDNDVIYMQIREHMVIVYRHGLYEFAIEESHQGAVTEFDASGRFGFIQSGNLPRIFVHINEVIDRTIMSLEVGQQVEFDINQTKRGLQAINVVLVDE